MKREKQKVYVEQIPGGTGLRLGGKLGPVIAFCPAPTVGAQEGYIDNAAARRNALTLRNLIVAGKFRVHTAKSRTRGRA